jgi:hypothetical protein
MKEANMKRLIVVIGILVLAVAFASSSLADQLAQRRMKP